MNLENMLSNEELIKNRSKYKKIFFFRICGTGMGACACLLKENGFEVEGADQNFYPPMSTYLDSTGIKLYSLDKVTKEFLQDYDLIIVGNSVPRNSDWARMIEESGTSFTSFPSALGSLLLKDKKVIGIAGTHGKTTTTYFLTQMLESLGLNPGYLIGGILDDRPPSTLGLDDYFVIESDEYDSAYFQKFSKFRLYELNQMILTSLEFDHADIYDNVEQIEAEFEAVMPRLESVIADMSYDSIQKLKSKYPDKKWFGYGADSELGPHNIVSQENLVKFELNLSDEKVLFETNIVGLHNILNISSCILFLHNEGFEISKIQNAVKELFLVKRRQENRGTYKGAIVIDDFAHHPRAIELTIDAIKTKYPTRKIITVFEPVSATARSNVFQSEFTESLRSSDEVIIAKNPMPTTAKSAENLDCDRIIQELAESCSNSMVVETLKNLEGEIDSRANDESLFLILSNRSCIGLWESHFVEKLS